MLCFGFVFVLCCFSVLERNFVFFETGIAGWGLVISTGKRHGFFCNFFAIIFWVFWQKKTTNFSLLRPLVDKFLSKIYNFVFFKTSIDGWGLIISTGNQHCIFCNYFLSVLTKNKTNFPVVRPLIDKFLSKVYKLHKGFPIPFASLFAEFAVKSIHNC